METNFLQINAKIDYYKNSFYPDAIRTWNNLDPSPRRATSFSSIKLNILKNFCPLKKNVFNVHEPNGIKGLYQLRVGLIRLRDHKKHHNFKHTPISTLQKETECIKELVVYIRVEETALT